MNICFVLADCNRGEHWREEERERLTSLARNLKPLGIQSVILYEVLDPQAEEPEVDIQQIEGGLLWQFTRAERPDHHTFADPLLDDILYKIVWEYGIELVHLFISQLRVPASLGPIAGLLGAKLVISSPDCSFTCTQDNLIDQDKSECTGPESVEKCAECLSCGKFSQYFASKHRIILWNKHLHRVFKSTSLLMCPNEQILDTLRVSQTLGSVQTAIVEWPLADEVSESLPQTLSTLYSEIVKPAPRSTQSAPISILIPAFQEWLTNSHMSIQEHLQLCLESLIPQAIKTRSQIFVGILNSNPEYATFFSQKFAGAPLRFLAFPVAPNLSAFLAANYPLLKTERTVLAPVDRTYSPQFVQAHARAAGSDIQNAVLVGLTGWTHSKPLASLEEHVLSESIQFKLSEEIGTLSSETPWFAASFPTAYLKNASPGFNTLGQALGNSALTVRQFPQALSALNEALTLERWLQMAQVQSAQLGRMSIPLEAINQDPELMQLSGSARGTLTAHRMLGLPTPNGIIAYGELMHKLLHSINPGVWLSNSRTK